MSAPEDPTVDAVDSPSPPGRKGGGWGPLVAVVVLVPILCYGVMDFLVIPKLQASVGVLIDAAETGGKDGAPAGKSGGATAGSEQVVEFGTTIVNLAGGSGSRYLRATFAVASKDPKIAEILKAHESALKDAAITVLSAQTLDDLDAEAGRNLARNQLIDQFNRTLGSEVVAQIYFSEFVVQ